MSKTTDVIVAGAGLAGLMAAYAAASKGARVKIITEGMGNLSISPGCIDVLGYDNLGQRLTSPWDGFANLAPEHPYSLLGQQKVQEALAALTECLNKKGCPLAPCKEADGKETNTLLPTIMGTFKPTWLVPKDSGANLLQTAKDILIISVHGFRDGKPALIANQLARYPGWENKKYQTLVLPAPFTDNGRSINALDLAHYLDRREGEEWLRKHAGGKVKGHDLTLMPPMLGIRPNSPIRGKIADIIGSPVVEMLTVPPGVAGLRIRKALIDTLVNMGVEIYENAQIIEAETENGICKSMTLSSTGRTTKQSAKTYVMATGGIIGGGILLDQGKAREAVFGINIPMPENVDEWSEPEIFGSHLLSRTGIKTDGNLQHSDLKNVYFAGKTLGGYDWAAEKSGHGVACATGWHAGSLAAAQALGGNQ